MVFEPKKVNNNGENLPNESTEFGFPLYINTSVIYDYEDYMERYRDDSDGILSQLSEWLKANYNTWIRDYEAYPIYIDGSLVIDSDYGSVHTSNENNLPSKADEFYFILDNPYGNKYSSISVVLATYFMELSVGATK